MAEVDRNVVFDDLSESLTSSGLGYFEFPFANLTSTTTQSARHRNLAETSIFLLYMAGYVNPIAAPSSTTSVVNASTPWDGSGSITPQPSSEPETMAWWQILLIVLVVALIVAFVTYIIVDLHRKARSKRNNKVQPLSIVEEEAKHNSGKGQPTKMHSIKDVVSTSRVSRIIATDAKLRDVLRRLENATISRSRGDVEAALQFADSGMTALRGALTSKAASTKRHVGRIRALVLKCKWLMRAIAAADELEKCCDLANELGAEKFLALKEEDGGLYQLNLHIDEAQETLSTDTDRRLQRVLDRGLALQKRLGAARGSLTIARVRKAVRSKLLSALRVNAAGEAAAKARRQAQAAAAPELLRKRLEMVLNSDDVVMLAELVYECEERQQDLPDGTLELVQKIKARLFSLISRPGFHVSFAGGVPGLKDERAAELEIALNRRNQKQLEVWEHEQETNRKDGDVDSAALLLCSSMRHVLSLETEIAHAVDRGDSAAVTAAVTKCHAADVSPENSAVVRGMEALEVMRLIDVGTSQLEQQFDEKAIRSLLDEISVVLPIDKQMADPQSAELSSLDKLHLSLAGVAKKLRASIRTHDLLRSLQRASKMKAIAHALVDGSRAKVLKLAIHSLEDAVQKHEDGSATSTDKTDNSADLDEGLQHAIDDGEKALEFAQELQTVAGAQTDAAAEDLRQQLDSTARSIAVEKKNTDVGTIISAFSTLRGRLATMRRSKVLAAQAALLQAINSQDLQRLQHALAEAESVGVEAEVLQHGRETVDFLKCRDTLRLAVEKRSAKKLKSGIARATAMEEKWPDDAKSLLGQAEQLLEVLGVIEHLKDVLHFPKPSTARLKAAEKRALKVIAADLSDTHDAELQSSLKALRRQMKWVEAQERLQSAITSRDPALLFAALTAVTSNEALAVARKKFVPLRKAVDKAEKLHEVLSAADVKLVESMKACQAEVTAENSVIVENKHEPTVAAENEAALRHAISEAAAINLSSINRTKAEALLTTLNSSEAALQTALNALAQLTSKQGRLKATIEELENAIVDADAAVGLASPNSELLEPVASKRKAAHKLLGVRKAEAYLRSAMNDARSSRRLGGLQAAIAAATGGGGRKARALKLGVLTPQVSEVLRSALNLAMDLEAEASRQEKRDKLARELEDILSKEVADVVSVAKARLRHAESGDAARLGVEDEVLENRARALIARINMCIKRGKRYEVSGELLGRGEEAVTAIIGLHLDSALKDAMDARDLKLVTQLLDWANSEGVEPGPQVLAAADMLKSMHHTVLSGKVGADRHSEPFGNARWLENPQYIVEVKDVGRRRAPRRRRRGVKKAIQEAIPENAAADVPSNDSTQGTGSAPSVQEASTNTKVSSSPTDDVVILARLRRTDSGGQVSHVALHVVANPSSVGWAKIVLPSFSQIVGSGYVDAPTVQFQVSRSSGSTPDKKSTAAADTSPDTPESKQSSPRRRRGHRRDVSLPYVPKILPSTTTVAEGPKAVVVRPRRFFLVPSAEEPGVAFEYEIELISTHELRVTPVAEKWVYHKVWEGTWDDDTAGGRRAKAVARRKGSSGKSSTSNSKVLSKWYNNPQLRIRISDKTLATPSNRPSAAKRGKKVTTCVVMRDGPNAAPGMRAAFHVVQNEWSMSFSSTACVIPNADRHHIVATSSGGYSSAQHGSAAASNDINGGRVAICEMQRTQHVGPEGFAEFPYFVVPSTSKVGQTGDFVVEVMATADLEVEEVTADDRDAV